ncbi:MAG: hypothetical protein AAB229_06780 [Candidatus Hydrogenedentota bacterium]
MNKFTIAAAVLVILNLTCMGMWAEMRPEASFEMGVDRYFQSADRAYRRGDSGKAYMLFRMIADSCPTSVLAAEATFEAGWTAWRRLGLFDEAEDLLTRSVNDDRTPDSKKERAQDALDILRTRHDLPGDGAAHNDIMWEYRQALTDENHGRYAVAITRYSWIERTYGDYALGKLAAKRSAKLQKKVREDNLYF